jgi:hypothetical protein
MDFVTRDMGRTVLKRRKKLVDWDVHVISYYILLYMFFDCHPKDRN